MRKKFTQIFSLALLVYLISSVSVVNAQIDTDCLVIAGDDVVLVTDITTVCDSALIQYKVIGFPDSTEYSFNGVGDTTAAGFTSDSTFWVKEGVGFVVQVRTSDTCYSKVLTVPGEDLIIPVTVDTLLLTQPTCFGDEGELTVVVDGTEAFEVHFVDSLTEWQGPDYDSYPSYSGTQFQAEAGSKYYVSVVAANGCTSTAWDSIVVDNAPAQIVIGDVNAMMDTVSCIGDSAYVAVSGVEGGAGGTYWVTLGGMTDTVLVENVVSFLVPAGTYTATVVDSFGCEVVSDSVAVIAEPDPITFDISLNDIACADSTDGVIYIHDLMGPSGSIFTGTLVGADTSMVSVAAVNDTITFTGLTVGYYGVWVSNGVCDSVAYDNPNGTGNVISLQAPGEIELAVVIDTAICMGDSSTIMASATGGSGSFEFSIDGGSTWGTDDEWKVVPADSPFNVVVRDAGTSSCEIPWTAITLTDPSQVSLGPVATVSPTCPGGNDGVINISASGGIGTIEYSLDSVAWYTNNIFAVYAGDYTVYVRSQLCTDTVRMRTPITVAALDTNVIEIVNIDSIDCYDASNGAITVKMTSWAQQTSEDRAVKVYYSIDENGAGTMMTGPAADSTYTAIELEAGTYYIWASDTMGCVFDTAADGTADILTAVITEEGMLTISGTVTGEASCYGSYDGEMTIVAGDGVPTLYGHANTLQAAMVLPDAAMTAWPVDADSVTIQVGKGTYYVVVKDDCGAKAYDGPFVVDGLEMVTIADTAMSVTDIICAGDSVGVIEIFAAEGGSEDFTYTLQVYDGSWVDVTGYVDVTETVFTGLPYGTYQVVVTDLGGCDGAETGTIEVDGPTIPVSFSLTNFTNITCNGASDGTIEILAAGGTGPYEFKVGTTNWRAFPEGEVVKTIVVTESGDYEVWVRDSLECKPESQSVTILEPDAIVVTVVETDATVACDDDGELAVTISGGLMGSYDVDYDIYIDDVLEDSHVGYPAGGGTYTYTGLTGGTYEIKVIENHGLGNDCEGYATAVIEQPDTITAIATVTKQVLCSGDSTGVITVSDIFGGNEDYTISITPDIGIQDSNIFELPAGFYDIEITDGSCTLTIDSVEITEPVALELTAEHIADITCVTPGQFSVAATGGVGDYKYFTALSILPEHILIPDSDDAAWQSDSIFSVTEAGTYIVWAIDANDCVIGGEENDLGQVVNEWRVKIAEPDVIVTVDASESDDPLCNGDMTASIIVDAADVVITIDGVPAVDPVYTVTIDNIETDTLENLGAGTYVVVVTHESGCYGTDTVKFEEPDVLDVILEVGDGEFTCPDVVEGYIEAIVTGGTEYSGPSAVVEKSASIIDVSSGYMYQLWQDGVLKTDYQPENSFLVQINHEYVVVVKDDNGCTDTSNVVTLDPVEAIEFTVKDITCSDDTLASVKVDVTGVEGRMFQVIWTQFEAESGVYSDSSEWFSGTIILDQSFEFDNENVDDIHYEFTVVDEEGCTAGIDTMTFDQIITAPLELTVSVVEAGECSSEVTITAAGGVAPYFVTINEDTVDITGEIILAAGDYEIIATDAHECTVPELLTVEANPVVRDTIIETFIGEATQFVDAEASLDTMLTVGMYSFIYMDSTAMCDRTLNVDVVEVPKPYTIAEIQGDGDVSPIEGEIAQITGTVTAVVDGEGFFVQDANAAWSGLWVEYSAVDVLEGDGVVVVGTVAEIASVTSIVATEVTAIAAPLVVEPVVLSGPSDVAEPEMYESVLVKFEGARATAADAVTGEWTIYYETVDEAIVINDWLFAYDPTEGNYYDVTGVVNGRLDNFKVEPRKVEDVVDLTATPVDPEFAIEFKVYPNPFSDMITIVNHDKLTRIVISNIAGQRVLDVEYPNSEIRTNSLVSGVYLISFITEEGIAKTDRIIKK